MADLSKRQTADIEIVGEATRKIKREHPQIKVNALYKYKRILGSQEILRFLYKTKAIIRDTLEFLRQI